MKKTKLYDFQLEDTQRIQKFKGRCLVANELGTGKSITSLYWAWKYLDEDDPGPIVIVCPAHLKIHWAREAKRHLNLDVEVLSNRVVPKDKPLPTKPNQIYVVNYDVLVPHGWKTRTLPPDNSWIMWLSALKPKLVIMDEGHFAKNIASARTRACKRLVKGVPHVLVLTGTPLSNKPPDMWSLINIVHPTLFPSQLDFNIHYTNASRNWYGWEFKGARNLTQLHNALMSTCMIRRRKCDVLDQLPAIQHTIIPIEVDLREYHAAESNFLGWMEDISPTLAKNAASATALTKLNFLKKLCGSLKVEAIIKWALDFLEESEGKLLLGAIHYDVTGPLVQAFGRKSCVLVDGRMNHIKKQEAFDRFNSDPKCRILVGNLDAAGTGWSCPVSSDPTLIELPWVPSSVAQFVGRCHGIGRGIPGTNTHARYLVAEGTVEEDLIELLQTKLDWSSAAVDGLESSEVDLRSALVSAMKKRVQGRG